MTDKFNWKAKREKKAFLALADGTVFRGYAFGQANDTVGEAVFNTGMAGYKQILTDPSYAGQFVVFTTAEVGAYAANLEKSESRDVFLNGIVVNSLDDVSKEIGEESLHDYMLAHKKPGIAGVDTRALTIHLRDHGAQKAYLHVDGTEMSEADAIKKAQEWEGLDGQDYASKVSDPNGYEFSTEGDLNVVALDFGIKTNILRNLAAQNMKVTVLPINATFEQVMAKKPDGVFLSNGPADPNSLPQVAAVVKQLLGKVPLMGICLGNQLLGLALGAKVSKLKFGHHGCNHPVKNLKTGAVEITSQNHNYAIEEASLPANVEVTHINLNDNTVEGIRHKELPAFSVQYHPESAPGPNDSYYLFGEFRQMIENFKAGNTVEA
ncbi:MAG: glutamine-hydrolyzing carbamoyl-phosphate synthase small subunit [Fibrobacter sp.]|uniref:glutamine-hydrolyzing carbamoyl-phosphate synthase small subunit n=1 Tax=Fibrobacter sp. TaxID=35828 RepID=UPI001B0EE58B|nr:glutamine-hydrolyzing carbamoyl-phosphate synthase small subunit [Fibrobacter sp.]MBO7062537.1 glutamine-hydrolyzing carbamoyl-phosphate synthase small subunit [Fibrobacter sp.]